MPRRRSVQNSLVCIGEGELSPAPKAAARSTATAVRSSTSANRPVLASRPAPLAANTPDDPFCTLDAGYTAALTQTNRTYVRVIGDNSPLAYYDAMSIPIDKGKFIVHRGALAGLAGHAARHHPLARHQLLPSATPAPTSPSITSTWSRCC